MKKVFALLFTLICMSLSAQESSKSFDHTVRTAINGAVFVGLSPFSYNQYFKKELRDWKRDDINSTISLRSNLEISSEIRLVGNRRMNYLLMAITNNKDKAIRVPIYKMTMTFSNSKERLPDIGDQAMDITLLPRQTLYALLPFPSKLDFKSQDWIQVKVPILSEDGKKTELALEDKLFRNKKIKEVQTTWQRSTSSEFELDMGMGIFALEGSKDVYSPPNFNASISYTFFPMVEHGIEVAFGMDQLSSDFDKLLSTSYGRDVDANLSHFLVSYVYRYYLSEKYQIRYKIGFNHHTFSEKQNASGKSNAKLGEKTGYQQRISYHYLLSHSNRGHWSGDYNLIFYFQHTYLPKNKLDKVEVGGHYASIGVGLSFGL